jgi:hypothetical protein|tara:strand:+ start:243 stop:662 length:420 start_codon:yes stop_codon:yes gene_type:complete
MKNFKTFMTEKPADQDLALDNRTNMGVFSDPSVIRKLNAWVGSIADNYVLPEDAIHRLRGSLSKIGLSFDEAPVIEGKSGSMSLPLTSFGGRFGKGINTPHDEFETDDGISHMVEGGLTLVIDYDITEDNSYHLHARIE